MTKRRPFIAVCIASRGTGHIRTMAGAVREVEPFPHVWCWSFGNPIPAAQNDITAQALADKRVTHLWFVEDDCLVPDGALMQMLAAAQSIVTIDYQTRAGRSITTRNPAGEIVLTGMGCLLVRREVFAHVPNPPFQVSTRYVLTPAGEWMDTGKPEVYGGHDAYFYREARKAGYRIHQLDGVEAGHLDVVRAGHRRGNYGYDEVISYGGVGVSLRPEPREEPMAQRWFRSPQGVVIDLDPKKGGQVEFYLRHGWQEISKTEAKPIVKRQERRNAEVIAQAQAEAEDDD